MKNERAKLDCLQSGLTKEHSKMLQGLAILMMLYHHLFTTPEAIGIEYRSLLNFGGMNVELRVAWLFKLCVGIYAFVSGYGLCRTLSMKYIASEEKSVWGALVSDYKTVINKLFSFYKVYWLTFIIFIPIGFMFFDKPFSISEFLLNLLGISSSYNGAWWYVLQYLKMLLVLPVIDVIFHIYDEKNERLIQTIYVVLIAVAVCVVFLINKPLIFAILEFFQAPYLYCFLMGYIIAKFRLYELVFRFIPGIFCYILGVMGFLAVILARVKIAKDASSVGLDYLFVPVFVFGFICISTLSPKCSKFFAYFGTHSTIMWLSHVFFYDHYAKRLVMMSHFSTTIYLTLIILSLVSSIIITKLYSLIASKI